MKGWIATVALEEGEAYRPTAGYSFADHTPHHRHVAAQDIFFIRSQTRLLAIARVQQVDVRPAEKAVQRCPTCGTGQIGTRSTRAKPYRCLFGHEFSQADMSTHNGLEYKAVFGLHYIELSPSIEAAELRPFELTNSRQLLLRPCDTEGLLRYISRRDRNVLGTVKKWLLERELILSDSDADTSDPETVLDEREHRLNAIRLRRGRKVFRDELIRRYGPRCLVSGCSAAGVIEAAYIQQDSTPKFNNPTNGLLLRSDLHTLFDLNLLGIHPQTLTVSFHPDLMTAGYKELDGRTLIIGAARGPNRRALAERWQKFQANLPRPDVVESREPLAATRP